MVNELQKYMEENDYNEELGDRAFCLVDADINPEKDKKIATADKIAKKYGIQVMQPRPLYCTDNGVMIACSAYYKMKKGEFAGPDLDAIPGLEF